MIFVLAIVNHVIQLDVLLVKEIISYLLTECVSLAVIVIAKYAIISLALIVIQAIILMHNLFVILALVIVSYAMQLNV